MQINRSILLGSGRNNIVVRINTKKKKNRIHKKKGKNAAQYVYARNLILDDPAGFYDFFSATSLFTRYCEKQNSRDVGGGLLLCTQYRLFIYLKNVSWTELRRLNHFLKSLNIKSESNDLIFLKSYDKIF